MLHPVLGLIFIISVLIWPMLVNILTQRQFTDAVLNLIRLPVFVVVFLLNKHTIQIKAMFIMNN